MRKFLSVAALVLVVLSAADAQASGWGRIITPVVTAPAQSAVVVAPAPVPTTSCCNPTVVAPAYYSAPVTVSRPVYAQAPATPAYYAAPVTVYRPAAPVQVGGPIVIPPPAIRIRRAAPSLIVQPVYGQPVYNQPAYGQPVYGQ